MHRVLTGILSSLISKIKRWAGRAASLVRVANLLIFLLKLLTLCLGSAEITENFPPGVQCLQGQKRLVGSCVCVISELP